MGCVYLCFRRLTMVYKLPNIPYLLFACASEGSLWVTSCSTFFIPCVLMLQKAHYGLQAEQQLIFSRLLVFQKTHYGLRSTRYSFILFACASECSLWVTSCTTFVISCVLVLLKAHYGLQTTQHSLSHVCLCFKMLTVRALEGKSISMIPL